jgi:FkbM family methyltransferase
MFQSTLKLKNAIGKLKIVKNLILSKLDTSLFKLDDLNQTSNTLLEASSYLIELQQETRTILGALGKTSITQGDSLESQQQARLLLENVISNSQALLTASAHIVESQQESVELQQTIKNLLGKMNSGLRDMNDKRQEVIRLNSDSSDNWASSNPEADLVAYLYSFLPSRKAIDIGANTGEMSAILIQAGFEVIAFEPYPATYEQLCDRFRDEPMFTAQCFAIGKSNSILPLNIVKNVSEEEQKQSDPNIYNSLKLHPMPEYLVFDNTIDVKVRSLESLQESQELPSDIAFVKIDTEGFDLEVIQGMGSYSYPVVMTEFWDIEMVFGGETYTIRELVKEMKSRGYHWHIVIYRNEHDKIRYCCNSSNSIPKSWGNVVFFQSFDVFKEAYKWCNSTLTETFFQG